LGIDTAEKKVWFNLEISDLLSIGAFPKTGEVRYGALPQKKLGDTGKIVPNPDKSRPKINNHESTKP
jgi:hypothetical protein